MPTIFTGAIDPSLSQSGIMSPRVGPGSYAGNQQEIPELPEDQQQQLTQRMFNSTYNENRGIPWYRGLAETVAGAGIDLVDTGLSSLYNASPAGMAQNLLGGPKPINRGDVWNLTQRYGGDLGSELQDYHTRNQSRIEMISGLTGAIATGYAAGEMLLPFITDRLAASTAINSSRLWQWGSRVNAATRTAMEDGQAQAAMAGEAYKMWRGAGALQYRGLQIAKGVGKAAFEELAVATTMNTNQFVWSDDLSENMFYSAIGLGVGGTLASYGARYEMRRLANDPTQILRRRNAIDPQGFYAMMEQTPTGIGVGAEAKESAEFTAQMLVARQITQPNADPKLASRFDTIRSQAEEQAAGNAQKISTKGITGVPNTRFNIEKTPGSAGAHFMEAAHEDPFVAFGLDSAGVVPEADPANSASPLYQMFETREKHTEDLRRTQTPSNIAEARRLEQQQALVLVDNQLLPAKTPDAYNFSTYRPDQIELKPTTKGINEFVFATDSGKSIRIGGDFSPKFSKNYGGDFSSLAVHDRLQITEAMTQLMKRMKATGEIHVVPENPSWFQLDSAVEFEKRGGKVDWHKSGDITNAEGARLASLRLKYLAVGTKPIGGIWERLAYNLPLPNVSERIYDGTGDSIRTALYGAAQGNDLSQVESLRQSVLRTSGFDLREKRPMLDGDMFNFNRTPTGKWKQPVLAFYDNSKINRPLDPTIIAQANAEIKASRINDLVQGYQAKPYGGMVQPATLSIITMPEFQRSRQISHLADDQVTGIGNKGSQFFGEFLTREFKDRDNPVLLDTLKVRENVNRLVDEQIHNLTKPLAEIQAKLTSAAALGSKTLVNQFFSNASGWDIEAMIPHGKFFAFTLGDTARNANRLGRSVRQGELLVNPRTGAEMVVDEIGADFINAFQDVASRILKDNNRLRIARGLSAIREKSFYVPPPDTRNAFVGYTFDEEGQLVPNGAIVNKDHGTFERLREEKVKNLPKGWTFKTRESIPATSDEYDRAAMDWIDPGVGYAPAAKQTGTLASDLVNPNAVGDTLQWIRRQVEQSGTNLMRVLYDSQLGIARARANVEAAVKGIDQSKNPIRTVWHEYQSIVLGQNLADSNNSITGPWMRAGEKVINGQLENIWPAVAWMGNGQVSQWVSDLANRMGVKQLKHVKSFNELATQLGPYSPYKSAEDYAEQTFKVSRPPEIREMSQQLGRLSSALVLRYFELPMAAMNMIGIITTMPSILRSGKAPISSYFKVGEDTRVGVVDTWKILAGAIKDHLDPAKAADWARMIRDGNTTQQVADFNKQLSTVTDRSSFNRVFFGDKTVNAKNVTKVRGVQDVKDIIRNKGIDGLISIATDTTENWSRSWAHFAGLRLADMHGIVGMDARHGFAQEIANAAIANYNPLNRPEFYQSAFGSMVGLFMSYMQSYNQRLFRWMETGDYKSIGSQLVMQSSLFGLASMPGFNAVQAGLMHAGLLKSDSGEDATLMDHIYAKLGPELGSAFAHGGLSQLGVALYTRGDMNYRDVTLDPTRLAAGLGILSSAASAVHEAAQSLFDPQSLDGNGRLLEVLARNMPNRVMKGILTQIANGGNETDPRGQLVTENRDFFETSLRMFGVRSTRQQGAIEAFYANKQLMAREAARMDVLRLETRSLIRNDPNWQGRIMEVFNKYVDGGGRPEHFRTWVKDQIQASTRTRDVNDLVKALKNPENQMQVWRYGAYNGGF